MEIIPEYRINYNTFWARPKNSRTIKHLRNGQVAQKRVRSIPASAFLPRLDNNWNWLIRFLYSEGESFYIDPLPDQVLCPLWLFQLGVKWAKNAEPVFIIKNWRGWWASSERYSARKNSKRIGFYWNQTPIRRESNRSRAAVGQGKGLGDCIMNVGELHNVNCLTRIAKSAGF